MTLRPTGGPPRGPAGDQLAAFAARPYAYLSDLWHQGDIVGIELGGLPTAVVYDLDAIHTVFADRLDHIGRSVIFEQLSHALGNGLLTNYDWTTWHPRRRVITGPLGPRAVGRYVTRMGTIIDTQLATWPRHEEIELHDRVRTLTLHVVADLLFSEDLTTDAVLRIEDAVEAIHCWAEADPTLTDPDHEPDGYRTAIDGVDDYIAEVVARRDPAAPGDDLLGVLLAASHAMPDVLDTTAVRDELITLVLTGHDTVAGTTTFALDLVARHPGTAHADPRHIIDETLRLFPPGHMTNKGVVKDLTLGDRVIPAGWEIVVPQHVLSRAERFVPRPEQFLPERWIEKSPLAMNPRAYFPFLTGPKSCVGRHFAMLEATEIVSRFLRDARLRPLEVAPPDGRYFAITFSPDRPVRHVVEPVTAPAPSPISSAGATPG